PGTSWRARAAGDAQGDRRAAAGQRPAHRPERGRERGPAAARAYPPARAAAAPAGGDEAQRGGPARRGGAVSARAFRRHGPARGPGPRAGAGSAADALRRTPDRPGPDRLRRDHEPDPAAFAQPGPDQHHRQPPRARDPADRRPGGGDRQPRHRVRRHPGTAAGLDRSADPPVPGRPAGRPDPVRERPRRRRPRGGRLMAAVAAIRSLGRAGLFSLSVLRASLPSRDFFAELAREIYKIGGRSLPIIAVGGAFVGLVLTLQGYRTLTTFGAADALSTLLGLSLYRELGPVLTALLFIGRAGSSIAAELGLMRATDQIKALELMAIDPVAKAVAPRFWAAVLTVPLLTGFFCSLAISASWFEAVQVLGLDNGTFWSALQGSVDFWDDFGIALLKSAVFGGTCALVAAFVGYHAEPTIEGTSVATTRAVVNASLLVLMFNFVMSALLFQ